MFDANLLLIRQSIPKLNINNCQDPQGMRYCAPARGAVTLRAGCCTRAGRRMVASAVTSRQPWVQFLTVITAMPIYRPARSSNERFTASRLGKSLPLTLARRCPLHSSEAQILSPRFTMLLKFVFIVLPPFSFYTAKEQCNGAINWHCNRKIT